MRQFMGNITKIRRGIKRSATTPKVPQTSVTPMIKPSPPSSSKKPKFSFKTGSKGKRLLPKTPLKTSSLKKSPSYFKKKISYQIPNSPSSFKTAEEDLGESLTELFLEEGASLEEQRKRSVEKIIEKAKESLDEATKDALKKLAPVPCWKPFGTPVKRKLDGQDF